MFFHFIFMPPQLMPSQHNTIPTHTTTTLYPHSTTALLHHNHKPQPSPLLHYYHNIFFIISPSNHPHHPTMTLPPFALLSSLSPHHTSSSLWQQTVLNNHLGPHWKHPRQLDSDWSYQHSNLILTPRLQFPLNLPRAHISVSYLPIYHCIFICF